MSKLILKNIRKTYDNGFTAVDNLSLETEDNDFLVLIGPSGCGKTTVLRMIAGLEDITAGDIILGDRRLNDLPPKKRKVGMVFQNYALYPHMSVYDNIAFPLKIAGIPKATIDKQVRETAELVGLESFIESKPKQLSGGQRQRTALARAIIRKPDIFLFDEPLSNLDANLRLRMRTEIKRLHELTGIPSVYVTHDQVEAMTMGSKIAVIKDGKLLQYDTPDKIYDSPEDLFTAKFIGNPQINIFKGIFKNGKVLFESNEKKCKFAVDADSKNGFSDSEDIFIGIRPENFSFSPGDNEKSFIDIEVERAEFLGHESIYYFRTDSELHSVRSPGTPNIEAGETIRLYFDSTDINFFDNSGKRSG